VLTLAGVELEPLAEEVLAVLVHVGSIPEEVSLVVDLVEDLEALLIGLGLAVEGALREMWSVTEESED
jgi:hypothetical protein